MLVLTTFDLDEYVFEALRAGASGFLLKDAPEEQLARGDPRRRRGGALFAPAVTRRLIERFAAPRRRRGAAARARRAHRARARGARLLARGRSNAEIAAELVVSEHTVKTHVAHVLAKLGLRDRVQAVILAYETGLVRPGV